MNRIRDIGIFVTFVFLTATFTPISNYAGRRFAPRPDIRPSKAIVVLGAGISGNGMLDNDSLRRAIYGIELFRQGFAPVLVFSGAGYGDNPAISEAEARSRLALTMGVPAQAILKEEVANTTREESIRISETLAARHIHQILLVTESLHMRRARSMFQRAGLEVFPAPSDSFSTAAGSPADRLWLTSRILQESMALAYYRLAGYI